MRLSDLTLAEKRVLLGQLLRERAGRLAIRLPLSYGQKALWYLNQFEPSGAAYNLSFAARVRGALDIPAFGRILQGLVDRHDALRTTFNAAGGVPFREVHARCDIRLHVEDGSSWSQDELRRRCREEVRAPFDLGRGPLLRSFLYTHSADESVLLLVAHHMVGDFWSLVLILEELGAAYQAETDGRQLVVPLRTATYGDFVRWQQELLSSESGVALESYWRRELAGELPELHLPIDHPRPPVQTYDGASHAFRLSEELTRGLKQLARDEGATLFTVLLAGYEVLLHRYSGQDDFLVGFPVAGRSQPAFRNVVGFFVNMVLLRAKLADDPPFRTFVAQTSRSVVSALEHQDYPFARLVERLAPPRDVARAPLLQATLVLQKSQGRQADARPLYAITRAGAEIELGGLRLESLGIDSGATQFELTLFLEEVDGALLSTLVYNTALFEAGTIERMAGHLIRLLEAIVADPARRVSELPLLNERERDELERWSLGPVVEHPPALVHQVIEAQAKTLPSRTAVRFGGLALTYEGLNRRANLVAHRLRASGVGPDVIVGLRIERSLELVVAILGVLKAGGAYLPLGPKNPPERTDFIIADAGVELLLTTRSASMPRPAGIKEQLNVDDLWSTGPSEADFSLDLSDEALAYVLYTSGSTGTPKGAMIPHRALRNHMEWMRREFPLDASDRVLQKTPFEFDASVWEFFAPLMQGAELVVAAPGGHEDVGYLTAIMAGADVTTVQTIPSLLALLIDDPGFGACRSLRRVFCGGERLSRAAVDHFNSRSSAELVNLYGPTEACIDATFWRADRATGTVPIGRPIDNTQCYVLDRYRQIVPAGVPGELYIGGAGLAHGYVGRPALTAERFVILGEGAGARFYRSGDLVRWCSGQLEFVGRADRQVKIRGFRVELDEIEQVLCKHPAVRQAAVVCSARAGTMRLAAYVACPQTDRPSADEFRAALRRELPDFMVPGAFLVCERLPLTTSGKVDYRRLPAIQIERRTEFVAPSSAVETTLVDIWTDVLGLERVSVDDNFFELGGDSILSLQVVSRAQQADLTITLDSLLRFQTISELAEAIARVASDAENGTDPTSQGRPPIVVPLQPLGALPPLFCVHPVEGAVHAFAALGRLLGDARPLYGIEAPELRDRDRPILPIRVEDLAAIYVDAVRSVQATGPYFIVGWSMGGAVAYEMAHQLSERGNGVAFLGLLDQGARPHQWTEGRTPSLPPPLANLPALLRDLGDGDGDKLTDLIDHPRVKQALAIHPDQARARRLLELTLRNESALRHYAPPPTTLRVCLFRSMDSSLGEDDGSDADLGWKALARGGVDVETVPGHHFTMLRFPHVRVLAERLAAALRRASEAYYRHDASPEGMEL